METLKIDKTRLKTVKSYAKMKGFTVQHIYNLVKKGELPIVKIDDVTFIQV